MIQLVISSFISTVLLLEFSLLFLPLVFINFPVEIRNLSPLTCAWARIKLKALWCGSGIGQEDSNGVRSEENKGDTKYDTEKEHGVLGPGFRTLDSLLCDPPPDACILAGYFLTLSICSSFPESNSEE